MRRKTRRALINVILFCSALFFILFLGGNGSASSNRTVTWTTVRYKPKSTNIPEARGICPGLVDSSKPALVVARVAADNDTKWLDRLANKYHFCIYTADAPLDKTTTSLQVPENRGHEAMAYLTFLIDNYNRIPSAGAVFVHGSRWSWHNDSPDYDNVNLLAALNISSALAPWGYHNLRCDWSASTCPTSEVAQGSFEKSFSAMLEPWNQRAVSDAALPHALTALFDDSELLTQGSGPQLGRNDVLRSQCCAQFVVSRESIWRHSRQEYIALRQWLLDGSKQRAGRRPPSNSNAAPQDDRIAGRILSYVWHILFLQTGYQVTASTTEHIDLDRLNVLACPSAAECYCRLYGRCNLEHCTIGRCHGQYSIPQGFRLPEDWAATHL
ncbi:hypothetical protein B7463_g8805, partial [Scytalidium lignicola]